MNALILLSGLGVFTLLAEIFRLRKFLVPIVMLALLGVFAANITEWNHTKSYYNDMMLVDNFAVAFTGLLVFVSFLWMFLAKPYFENGENRADRLALVVFALVGAVVMVSYANLTMLFLGIEILSISMYILAGSRKSDKHSNEAAFKYFLMGAFATAFLLLGIAFIYGAAGSFHLSKIAEYAQAMPADTAGFFYAGILLMLVGLAFKVSAVPFHFWVPDVYEGSPHEVTAFMSTVVKTAAIAAFFRLFSTCFTTLSPSWTTVLWILSALTILVGNITAVYQTNLKRMLAYSSISHAGYMLIAILAMNKLSAGAIFYYAAAYSLSSLAIFAVLIEVDRVKGNSDMRSFAGLAANNPLLAFMGTVAMLSLSGIPPAAGFFAKYYIFTAAIQQGYVWLVAVAILGSLIGVYYYFRFIVEAYRPAPMQVATDAATPTIFVKVLLFITFALTLFLGIFPELAIRLLN